MGTDGEEKIKDRGLNTTPNFALLWLSQERFPRPAPLTPLSGENGHVLKEYQRELNRVHADITQNLKFIITSFFQNSSFFSTLQKFRSWGSR